MIIGVKKTILIDLDGVLNEYTGDYDKDFIPKIKPGAKKFLQKLSREYTIKIFTTRNKLLTAKWLIKNKIDTLIEDIIDIKEPCWLYIDDRCLNFNGDFSSLYEKISDFKPYYK